MNYIHNHVQLVLYQLILSTASLRFDLAISISFSNVSLIIWVTAVCRLLYREGHNNNNNNNNPTFSLTSANNSTDYDRF